MADSNNGNLKKRTQFSVSVIVPAYNEEDTVATVIDEIKTVMEQNKYNYEIIVVDDGSTDKTPQILKGREDIILLRNASNEGYGAALKAGIKHATNGVVVITDADGTYPVARIPELLEHIGGYDMAVAARTGNEISMPFLRRAAKGLLNILANYLSGKKIPDLNSGMRVIKKNIALNFLGILPDGFSFTTTITLAALAKGNTIKYIPISYRHRKRKSKFHPFKDTMNMFTLIIRTILYFNPLKIFVPLSVALIAAGLIVFIWSMIFLPKILDITTLLLIVTGIQVMVIGLLADLIDKRIG